MIEDDDGDDWDDYIGDEVDDADGGDDESTTPCPTCGEDMFEDATRCPSCGTYVSLEDNFTSSKPAWIVLTAVLCLVMAVAWVLRSF